MDQQLTVKDHCAVGDKYCLTLHWYKQAKRNKIKLSLAVTVVFYSCSSYSGTTRRNFVFNTQDQVCFTTKEMPRGRALTWRNTTGVLEEKRLQMLTIWSPECCELLFFRDSTKRTISNESLNFRISYVCISQYASTNSHDCWHAFSWYLGRKINVGMYSLS